MDATIVVALIAGLTSLVGSLGGAFVSNQLQKYRLEQVEKKIEKIPEIEKEIQETKSELVQEAQSLHGEINSFNVNASQRKKAFDELEDDVEKLKVDVGTINTRLALVESQIKMYHSAMGD